MWLSYHPSIKMPMSGLETHFQVDSQPRVSFGQLETQILDLQQKEKRLKEMRQIKVYQQLQFSDNMQVKGDDLGERVKE